MTRKKETQEKGRHITTPKEFVTKETPNILDERLIQIKNLFPEILTDGKIDFEKLRLALGDEVDGQAERYNFTWAGKRDAIRMLQTPSRATLLPCKEESVSFDTSQNIFIEGENLEVLKLLYKPYFGGIKMIYIDPPYNTGNDFVYPDNFSDPLDAYLCLTGQKDAEGNLLTSNPETSGRYHSAWLSMMYPRLFLARQLLRDDGLIFVSIDDHEVHNLRMLMNEVFGEENFIDNIIWKKRYGGGAKEKHLVSVHEYILFFAKNKELLDPLFIPTQQDTIDKYYKFKDEKYILRGPYRTHPLEATKSMGERKNLVYAIPAPDGSEIYPKRQWLWQKDRTMKALAKNELEFIKNKNIWSVHTKQYLRDDQGNIRGSKAFSIVDNVYTQHGTNEIIDIFGDAQTFPFPKPTGLIKPLLQIATTSNEEDVVLDFFAGSCTTAQAVLELNREDGGNRRFIMVQLPEPTGNAAFSTIAAIGKERIRRVVAKMNKANEAKLDLKTSNINEDLGFKVFKLTTSNYRLWTGIEKKDQEDYAKTIALFADPLVEGWIAENVIYEAAIKEGYGLNCQIEPVQNIEGNTVCRVTDPDKEQSFYICLDAHLEISALKALSLTREDMLICRDTALDDSAAANLALQCRLKTI
jgi:adenine-specific DNA-methyltransferase